MPRLRRVSGMEAIRALERLGFAHVSQRGSHVILKKETAEGTVGCVVPLHRELAIGALRRQPYSAEKCSPALWDRVRSRVGHPVTADRQPL
jgi:predicted RNA binding protein YcfA (HicA-like mRNA interferase family)